MMILTRSSKTIYPVHTRKSLKVDQEKEKDRRADQGIEKNLEADQKIGDLVEDQDQENISHEDIPPGQSQEKRKMIKIKNLKIKTRMKPSKRFLLEVECGFQLVRTVLLMESKRLSTKLKRKKEEDQGMIENQNQMKSLLLKMLNMRLNMTEGLVCIQECLKNNPRNLMNRKKKILWK